MSDRARQFMPFAALKGYYEMIDERKRIKMPKKLLGEDAAQELSDALSSMERGDMVRIVYYDMDSYVTVRGVVSEIDFVMRTVTVVKKRICFDDISEAEKTEIRE